MGDEEAIGDWFGVGPEDLPEFDVSFNIAPQRLQPVLRLSPETDVGEPRKGDRS
jgi:hypothetical protein